MVGDEGVDGREEVRGIKEPFEMIISRADLARAVEYWLNRNILLGEEIAVTRVIVGTSKVTVSVRTPTDFRVAPKKPEAVMGL